MLVAITALACVGFPAFPTVAHGVVAPTHPTHPTVGHTFVPPGSTQSNTQLAPVAKQAVTIFALLKLTYLVVSRPTMRSRKSAKKMLAFGGTVGTVVHPEAEPPSWA